MARPRYGTARKPNTTAMRVKEETKSTLNRVYTIITGNPAPNMPLGDKLDSILESVLAARKKEKALEGEIRELSNLLAKQYGFEENKPLEVTV